MTVFRTAYVYVRNMFAGTLKETDEGYTFRYDSDMHLKIFHCLKPPRVHENMHFLLPMICFL